MTEREFAEVTELTKVCNSFESLDYLHPDPEIMSSESNIPNKFVYFDRGTLVGFLALYVFRELEAYLVVHPHHRRRGIGSALLQSAKESCKEKGISKFLLVREDKSISGKAFVEHVSAQYLFSNIE